MKDLTQCVILTGAGGGVGRDACRTLAQSGYRVFAGVIDPWERRAVEDIKARHALDALQVVDLDLRRHEHIQTLAARIAQEGSELRGLVLNGAASPQGVPTAHTSAELLRDTFETNVIGGHAAVRACLPLLRASRGRIVFVSSATTFAPPPLVLPYATTKCAINAMAHSLRRELRNTGVSISLLLPEVIKETYMAHGLHEATKRRLAQIRGCRPEEVTPVTLDPGGNTALMQPDGGADPFYEGMLAGQLKTITMGLKIGIPPSRVTRDILRALSSPRPRPIYIQGFNSHLFRILGSVLPVRWMDWVTVKIIGYR